MSGEAPVSDKDKAFDVYWKSLMHAVDQRIKQHKRDLTTAAARGESVDPGKLRKLNHLTLWRKREKDSESQMARSVRSE